MRKQSVLFAAALSLLGMAQAATTSVTPIVLVDGTWAVTRLSSGQTMPVGVRSVLNFVGGRISGNTACNQVMGSYVHSGTSLSFKGLASTRKACSAPINTTESLILKSLNGAQKVYVYGPIGQRSMRLSGSGGTLYLVKQK